MITAKNDTFGMFFFLIARNTNLLPQAVLKIDVGRTKRAKVGHNNENRVKSGIFCRFHFQQAKQFTSLNIQKCHSRFA